MMHKRLLPLGSATVLLFVAALPTLSHSEDEATIRVIRQQCQSIDRGANHYTKKERELPNESTEGTLLVGHYQSGKLRKLVVSYYGESGRAVEEYYLAEGKPIFVLRTHVLYKAPLNSDQKGEGETIAVTKERFYFQDAHLVRWMGTDNTLKATATPDAKSQEKKYNQNVIRFVQILAKPPARG